MSDKVKSAEITVSSLFGQKLLDYKLLVKLRLTLTVVFSSVMAFLIAAPEGRINLVNLLVLAIGGFLVTGASNALNQVLEKDYDRLMKRTENRPLAAGRMSISEAVLAAGFMSLVGISLLALFNPWAAFFGMLALVSYAFVYTPLKRITPAAVFVGAIPGALPVLIGCVAAEGYISTLAIALFTVQFFWQFPHFWSIGWLGFDDYRRAGYRIIPEQDGGPHRSIGLQSALYGLLLIPVVLTPYWLGATGWISALAVVLLSMAYAGLGWRFYRCNDRKAALQLMFYSFMYIPFSLIALFIDKI